MITDDLFDDHVSKCRVCFRDFKDLKKKKPAELFVELDDSIRQQFQLFTRIELSSSSLYSTRICIMCTYEIKRIMKFRETISERQKRLYELHPDPNVKSKLDDIIEYNVAEMKKEELETGEAELIQPIEEVLVDVKPPEPKINRRKQDLGPFRDDPVPVKKEKKPRKSRSKQAIRERELEKLRLMKEALKMYNCEDDSKLFNTAPDSVLRIAEIRSTQQLQPDMTLALRQIEKLRKQLDDPPLATIEYQCDICGFQCTSHSNSLIRNHISTKHYKKLIRRNTKFMCDHCGSIFKSKLGLQKHMTNKCQNPGCICDTCGENFENRTKLYLHKYIKHRPKGPTVFCDLCNMSYSNKKILLDHMRRIHMNLEPSFLCHLCSRTYVTRISLSVHMHKHRKAIWDVKVQCPECSFQCRRSRLLYHTRVYHEGLRYTCVFSNGCESIFCSKAKSENHLRLVHNVIDKTEMKAFREKIRLQMPIVISAEERDAFQGRKMTGHMRMACIKKGQKRRKKSKK